MARIKKFAGDIPQGLSTIQTFIVDENPNSDYFRISDFKDTFTGGKNGFLIEGTPYLKETTEVKIEVLDVEGNTVYYEPGEGIPEYYEGLSKVVSVHIYEDTPIGIAKITILGELKQYLDTGGVVRDIPEEWKGLYNVKWEREFKVNKNLNNEDKVRFYRRPDVAITEIARPIYSWSPITVTQTGSLLGTPIIPGPGTNINTFPRPSQYLLTTLDDTRWTGSVVNSTITLTDTGEVLNPLEVVSDTELIVSTPYTENSIVRSFSNKPYSTTFSYLENNSGLGTALSGSFGKFIITNLETFVGDVARVKVFRKSQAELADFQFVQEYVLESSELLLDYESSEREQENFGLFTPFIIDNYWVTSSLGLSKEFNQTFLYNSVKLESSGEETFSTSGSLSISNGVEYTITFNAKIEEVTSGDFLEVYIQGTKNDVTRTQLISRVEKSNTLLQKTRLEFNFIGQDYDTDYDGSPKLYFKTKGTGWYISAVSLRASQETSFSPDEITFLQSVPRNLPEETFDFKFEFYDINNNYIPVTVTATKTFNGGNLNALNKRIEIVPTSLYFQFDSGSQQGNALPPKTIFFDINKEFLTGSVNFTSGAYDQNNNLLDSAQYAPTFYPGLLEPVSIGTESERYRLTVENFSGSIYENIVQYIEYTAEVEGVSDSAVITRVSDGKGGVNFEIRPYRGTTIRNNTPLSSLEVQAVRIDGINEVNLRAGLPLDYSVPKLYINLGTEESPVFKLISEAVADGDLVGATAGVLGSGEIDYNVVLDRDGIVGQRTLYLIPSTSVTEDAVLATITLTDLLDGLDRGFMKYDVDTFTIDPYVTFQNTSFERNFIPSSSGVTGSFYRRGTTENPISGLLDIYPTMSINPDFNPQFWLYYITGAFNNDVSVSVTDENSNAILPQNPLETFQGSSRPQHKQLNVTYTYTEPYTYETVNVDQTFQIVPEGKAGRDSIQIELDPRTVTLIADESRLVTDYEGTITEIKVKQGSTDEGYLTYNETQQPGTFYINPDNVITQSIRFNGFSSAEDGNQSVITNEYFGFPTDLDTKSARVTFPIEIRPYFTSSFYTTFASQSIVRSDTPPAARGLTLVASSNTVTYNGDGNLVSPIGDITLTATALNTTSSADINFFLFRDGFSIGSTNTGNNVAQFVVPSGDFPVGGDVQTYRVDLHDGNNDATATPQAIASTTITGVQDGSPNYQVSLTNQNAVALYSVNEQLDFSNTSTQIIATKGGEPLTAVTSFSPPTFDDLGNIVPNGEYKVTLTNSSSFLDVAGALAIGDPIPVVGGVATLGVLDGWTDPINDETLEPQNSAGFIEFTVDFEDGRDTQTIRQNLSISFEGNVGPGLIMRGVYTASLQYLFDIPRKRRDAVIFPDPLGPDGNGETYYWATLTSSLGNPPPSAWFGGEPSEDPRTANDYWEYLGKQEFFVAAKMAIFEESFVKNTINVGNNPGNAFANIVLAGGRVDPYIAVAQSGTVGGSGTQGATEATGIIGYNRPGIFMGVVSSSLSPKTPKFSLRNADSGDDLRYLRWDGENLEISGSNFRLTGDGDVYMNGTLNAKAGNFEGNMTVANGTMKIGANVSGTDDGIYINSNNYWFNNGNFSVGGSGGSFTFSGGSGTININDVFTVNPLGELNAAAGQFTGIISSSNGRIGGWIIDDKAISSEGGNITFTGAIGEETIVVLDSDGIAKLSVDTDTVLPSLSGGATAGPYASSLASSTAYSVTNTIPYQASTANYSQTNNIGTFNCGLDGNYDVSFTTSPAASNGITTTAQYNNSNGQITVYAQIYNNTDGVIAYSSQVGSAYSFAAGSNTNTVTGISGTITRSGRIFMENGKQYIFRYYTYVNLIAEATYGAYPSTSATAQRLILDYSAGASLTRVGTFINGGGFQTIKDGNNYLRFNAEPVSTNFNVGSIAGSSTTAVRTDLEGGLGVDNIFTNANLLPAESFTGAGAQDKEGYVKLANNLYLQFGYNYTAGDSTPTITFPLTFDYVYTAMVHTDRNTRGTDGANHIDVLGAGSMTVVSDNSDGRCWWMAVGIIE